MIGTFVNSRYVLKDVKKKKSQQIIPRINWLFRGQSSPAEFPSSGTSFRMGNLRSLPDPEQQNLCFIRIPQVIHMHVKV